MRVAGANRPNSRSRTRYPWLAAALVWQGNLDEAREALSYYAGGWNATKSIGEFRMRRGYFSPNLEHVFDGLRRAGIPEK